MTKPVPSLTALLALPNLPNAACARHPEPELWFTDTENADQAAKQICAGCAARERCLEYALQHHPLPGVWGALTEHERGNLKTGRSTRRYRKQTATCRGCDRPLTPGEDCRPCAHDRTAMRRAHRKAEAAG